MSVGPFPSEAPTETKAALALTRTHKRFKRKAGSITVSKDGSAPPRSTQVSTDRELQSTRALGLLKFTASDLSHSVPTDRPTLSGFSPAALGSAGDRQRGLAATQELAAAQEPRATLQSNFFTCSISERKPLHRIGKEETITLDHMETFNLFSSKSARPSIQFVYPLSRSFPTYLVLE